MPNWLTRLPWWAALTLIGGSAAGITAWSLYIVAHDMYGVPKPLAILTAAVFDGTAIACLYLANQAVKEQRSALGPETAALGMAGISVYLNALHAQHINGGFGATLLFAVPTIALMLICGLAWSSTRARLRAADGDRPVALPRYGVWGWLLAWEQATTSVKNRAVAHVTSTDPVRTESGPNPDKPRDAAEVLRRRFADMDPADAIRIAHEAQPALPPAELAAQLVACGVIVDAVQVALVLGTGRIEAWVDRPDTSGQAPDKPLPPASTPALTSPDRRPDVSRPVADGPTEAVRMLFDKGVTEKSAVLGAAPLLLKTPALPDSIRTAYEREAKKRGIPTRKPEDDWVGKGGGGYE